MNQEYNAIVLSIVIPFYRGMKYIERTVDALRGIECNKEILIVDDGSGDGCYEKIVKLFSGVPEVQVLTKENGGIASTKNFGLDHLKGRYAFFCDQDDVPNAEVISKALEKAVKTESDMSLWTTEWAYEDIRSNKGCDVVKKETVLERSDVVDVLLKQTLLESESEYCSQIIHLWMGLFRTEFIREAGLRFRRFVDFEDDLLFMLDSLSVASRVCMIPEVGYEWYQYKSSKSHKISCVRDYVAKSEGLYAYYDEIMDRAGVTDNVRDLTHEFTARRRTCNALKEWAKIPDKDEKREEKTRISKMISEYSKAGYYSAPRNEAEKRERKTCDFLRNGKVEQAFIYNDLWKYYFAFRVWGGKVKWGLLKK